MPRNTDPFAPWNDPCFKNDPCAAHNDPCDKNDPCKPWNEPFGSANDLDDNERRSYGLGSRRSGSYFDDDY